MQSLQQAAGQQAAAAQAADERWRAEREASADAEARVLRTKAEAAAARAEQLVRLRSAGDESKCLLCPAAPLHHRCFHLCVRRSCRHHPGLMA
jgi:hypothetical protein